MKLPLATTAETSDTRAVINISIPAGSEAFDGHFPGTPILPGVVQIDWAVRFAHEYLKTAPLAAKDFKVKFNRIISPDMALVLNLELENGRINFNYQVGGEQMSAGQIRL